MWKEKNFFTKTPTSIRMKLSKRENILIKDNITRDIYTPGGHIKTFNTFMTRTITKKNTTFRAEREFVFVIRMKVGPTRTAKTRRGS
jgi:hypothetical protein